MLFRSRYFQETIGSRTVEYFDDVGFAGRWISQVLQANRVARQSLASAAVHGVSTAVGDARDYDFGIVVSTATVGLASGLRNGGAARNGWLWGYGHGYFNTSRLAISTFYAGGVVISSAVEGRGGEVVAAHSRRDFTAQIGIAVPLQNVSRVAATGRNGGRSIGADGCTLTSRTRWRAGWRANFGLQYRRYFQETIGSRTVEYFDDVGFAGRWISQVLQANRVARQSLAAAAVHGVSTAVGNSRDYDFGIVVSTTTVGLAGGLRNGWAARNGWFWGNRHGYFNTSRLAIGTFYAGGVVIGGAVEGRSGQVVTANSRCNLTAQIGIAVPLQNVSRVAAAGRNGGRSVGANGCTLASRARRRAGWRANFGLQYRRYFQETIGSKTYVIKIFNSSATDCFLEVTAVLDPKVCTPTCTPPSPTRSEERRVGKEC